MSRSLAGIVLCTFISLSAIAHAQPVVADPIPADRRAQIEPARTYRPATLYFGGYRNMHKLADADVTQWAIVREHIDGILLHGAYWLHEKSAGDVAKTFAQKLGPDRPRLLLETGFPHHTEPADRFADMGGYYARMHLAQIATLEASGLRVDELSVDWRLWIHRMIAQQNPTFTAQQVVERAVDYWNEYVRVIRATRPDLTMNNTFTPVQLPWKGELPYGRTMVLKPLLDGQWPKYNEGKPILVEGREVHLLIDGHDLFQSMFVDRLEPGTAGAITDSPNHYSWEWTDVAAQVRHRTRILSYERWLQDRGLKHTFIANESAVDWSNLPPDEAHRQYKRRSLLALQRYQLDGGRADRYLLESWYVGPHEMVPETLDGTFTNLAAEAIRYLKGIDQTLRLTLEGDTLTITNTGDVACLPAIRSDVRTDARFDGRDVSSELMSEEGFVPDRLLAPGDSLALEVRATSPATIVVYWNPQDPARTPRAQVRLQGR